MCRFDLNERCRFRFVFEKRNGTTFIEAETKEGKNKFKKYYLFVCAIFVLSPKQARIPCSAINLINHVRMSVQKYCKYDIISILQKISSELIEPVQTFKYSLFYSPPRNHKRMFCSVVDGADKWRHRRRHFAAGRGCPGRLESLHSLGRSQRI